MLGIPGTQPVRVRCPKEEAADPDYAHSAPPLEAAGRRARSAWARACPACRAAAGPRRAAASVGVSIDSIFLATSSADRQVHTYVSGMELIGQYSNRLL